jgi:predicted RNA-binding protein with PUA-like domain
VVDLKPLRALKRPITLAEIKAAEGMNNVALVKQGRLSVLPLTEDEYNIIVGLAG